MAKKSKNQETDHGKFVRMEKTTLDEVSHFLFAVGNQFVTAKNASAAFDCFKYAVDLNPKFQPAVYNLGCIYNVTGNLEGAYRMFKEAIRMRPEDIVARTAFGEIARKLGNVEESGRVLTEALALDPENYLVMSALAILHYDNGRLAEAAEWNEKAIEKMGRFDAHMTLNRALLNMTTGKWSDWWNLYEFCLSYAKNPKMKGLSMSESWSGDEHEGKTLLVVSDQGAGDALQFSRYLKEAKELGKFSKLVFLCPPELKTILARVDGIDEVLGFNEQPKANFDKFSSLLGIMRVLQINPHNCYRDPHLTARPKLQTRWEHTISGYCEPGQKRVGLVWAGDPRHGNDHARSLPLSQFWKLTDVPNVAFFSLQVDDKVKQLQTLDTIIPSQIHDIGSEIRDYDDTAAAISCLDLIISCDTSIAHAAGGLGKNSWILIANPPEWRWLSDLQTTAWYKNTRLFRQTKPRDWDPVLAAVREELTIFARHDDQE